MVESSDYSSILERVLFFKHTLPRELWSTASSIRRMHSSLFNSSLAATTTTTQHHQSMSHRRQYQQSPRRTPDLSASSSTSSLLDLLRMSEIIDFQGHDKKQTEPLTPPNREADKLQRNSIYLTFNAPQVDEYHRGLFLTHHPDHPLSDHRFSGTLFHASYIPIINPPLDQPKASEWVLETRGVKDVTTSASLVLMIRLGTLSSDSKSVQEQFEHVSNIIARVPLGRENRETVLGKMKPGEGNPVLDGYDCIVWTKDTLAALAKEGLVDLGGRNSDEAMAIARALAGPPDAKTMVGVDFGGLRVLEGLDHKPKHIQL